MNKKIEWHKCECSNNNKKSNKKIKKTIKNKATIKNSKKWKI
jgi:hypothetical protein